MKAVVIIKYIVSCAKAIIEGLEVVGDNWPTDSPFNALNKVGQAKSQGRASQPTSNKEQQIQGAGKVYNSTGKA